MKRLQADLRHPLKLLRDLPIALASSKAAQQKAVEAEDRDLTELGAMAYEQHRIEKEINQQQAKVNVIRQSIASIPASKPKTKEGFSSSVQLRWGVPYTIEGAAIVAFQSADAYARQYASASTPPAAAAASESAPAEPDGSKKRQCEEEDA